MGKVYCKQLDKDGKVVFDGYKEILEEATEDVKQPCPSPESESKKGRKRVTKPPSKLEARGEPKG